MTPLVSLGVGDIVPARPTETILSSGLMANSQDYKIGAYRVGKGWESDEIIGMLMLKDTH